jgi:aspartyl-tRNA synthetase
MAVAILAIRFRGAPDRRTAQVLAVIGLLFLATRTAANTASLAIAGDDQAAKLRAIDYMPRGARVISLVGMTCQEYWPMLRNGHLGAMVIVRREGFANDQWVIEGVNLLDLKYKKAGYFAADPSQLVRPNNCRDPLHRQIGESLRTLPRNDFDFVWLIDPPPYDPQDAADMQPVWRGPDSVLYKTHQ